MPKKTKKRVIVKNKRVSKPVLNKSIARKTNNSPQGKGFGIAGFVLGLIGVILSFFLIFSLLGLIFSLIQIRKKSNGLSIAGLILSIIGIVFFLLIMIAIILAGYSTVR